MPTKTWTDGVSTLSASDLQTYIMEQVCVTCTSSTRPTNVEGRLIYETDTDRLLMGTGSGTNWIIMAEPEQSFTPTWTQGATISKTVTSASYKRRDGRCSGWYNLAATSAGTAANVIYGGLPVASTDAQIVGTVHLYDASAGTFYCGHAYAQTSTTFSILTNALAAAGISTPTIASGDLLRVWFDYPMATRYTTF